MRECIKDLERRVEELGGGGEGESVGADLKKEMKGGGGGKRVEVKDGKRREAVEEVLKVIRVKTDVKEIRKLGEVEGKGGEMLLLKIEGRRTKEKNYEKKERVEGQKREDYGRFDIKREKDKVETRRDSKAGREERDENMGGLRKDKDWEAVVDLGRERRERGSAEGQ